MPTTSTVITAVSTSETPIWPATYTRGGSGVARMALRMPFSRLMTVMMAAFMKFAETTASARIPGT